jgi:S1-C subfamily serine protease
MVRSPLSLQPVLLGAGVGAAVMLGVASHAFDARRVALPPPSVRLGLTAVPVAVPGRRRRALIVTSLAHRGPAERAGVRIGDVVTAVAGEPVATLDAADRAGAKAPPPVRLSIARGGVAHDVALR